ncbi:protein RoBo-1-like [Callospermophilus lateralis]|uniref:protein RoBo-1-like n=1 Tax=Callospermophilus lateralis TaxID=76772 RepID=UPI004054795A
MVTSVQVSTLRGLSTLCIFVALVFSTVGISPTITQDKGCSSSACTPLSFSATVRTGWTFVYENQCCTSKQCNKADIQLSPVSKEENGIVCPACFSENGTFCSPQPLKCTGAETKCVEVIGKGGRSERGIEVVLAQAVS